MYKYILIATLFALFFSCKDKSVSVDPEKQSKADSTAFSKLTKKEGVSYTEFLLSGKAKQITVSWKEFKGFQNEIENILTVDYGVLSVELELFEKAYADLLQSEFPAKLNSPAIKSRLTVIKTFVSKLIDEVDNNESVEVLETSLDKISVAYNALKNQIMDVYESDIDEDDLIFEEDIDTLLIKKK
jgi:hypothetical protein